MPDRITWDQYFLEIAKTASKRASCFRGKKVGAVLVKGNQILATGYNGAPKGVKDCLELNECLRAKNNIPSGERLEFCMATHAEQNAVAQAASQGIATDGAILYTTRAPCVLCAKLLINAGVKEIIFLEEEKDELSKGLLEQAGVEKIKVTVLTGLNARTWSSCESDA
ncbi:cytidine deaminase [Candidatus Heimdallarchaeota archaeon B3_Heim]|nr:MAG: cytidine deaminase [Candidatus Heimdallarchaeota archaeon B3_Heim]